MGHERRRAESFPPEDPFTFRAQLPMPEHAGIGHVHGHEVGRPPSGVIGPAGERRKAYDSENGLPASRQVESIAWCLPPSPR